MEVVSWIEWNLVLSYIQLYHERGVGLCVVFNASWTRIESTESASMSANPDQPNNPNKPPTLTDPSLGLLGCLIVCEGVCDEHR